MAPGKSDVHAHGEGQRVMALESREGTRASRRVEERLSRSSRGAAETLVSLAFCRGPSGTSQAASERRGILWSGRGLSGLRWVWRNGRGPHLEGRQGPQASSPFRTPTAGPCRIGIGGSGLVLPEEGNSACLSSCSGGLRPLVVLCVEPAGVSELCTGVSVPLRVVPSPTGLPSKRCPGIGFLSRADREIRVVRHVAPPTWLVSNFLVRPASS